MLTYDALSLFEFSVACEVFGGLKLADLGVEWYRTAVCGDARSVRFDNGLRIDVPQTLRALRNADIVVLPPCEDPGAVSDATLAAVRRAHRRGARLVSLCAGAFVLARTGLLDGRRAVTHWSSCAALAEQFPDVLVDPSVLYIDDGDILTSAGSAASIDLCLHVVRTDLGAEVSNRLARSLVVQPHRAGGQAQYIETPLPVDGPGQPLTEVISWMSAHLEEDVSVDELARRAAMSPRSFARHFVAVTGSTPYKWLLRLRVERAQLLLEATDLPVEAVAHRAGLGDATNLRKQFRRQLATTPTAYREAFGHGEHDEPAIGDDTDR